MKDFKVNEYIDLKLEEDNKTYIYIKGEKFRQCKFLLVNIPTEKVSRLDEIESVDEAVEKLARSLELGNPKRNLLEIPPEVEFWGHCSNLQAWAENNYNTSLIHSNLAFPLLKKLTEVGDLNAKKFFKEEIGRRFEKGPDSVRQYLAMEGYLDLLSKEELWSIMPNQSELVVLQDIERIIGAKFKLCSDNMEEFVWGDKANQMAFSIRDNHIKRVDFYNFRLIPYRIWKKVFQKLGKLNAIKDLAIFNCKVQKIPKEIRILKTLEGLFIYNNELNSVPDSIGELKNLKSLYLEKNKINLLPESIGNLDSLKILELGDNKLKSVPRTIGNLSSLENLNLRNNLLIKIPNSIGYLKSLKKCYLQNNQLYEIPESIGNLELLEGLFLGNNMIKRIPESIGNLGSLKILYLENNNLKTLPESFLGMKKLIEFNIQKNKIQNSSKILKRLKKKRKFTLRM